MNERLALARGCTRTREGGREIVEKRPLYYFTALVSYVLVQVARARRGRQRETKTI